MTHLYICNNEETLQETILKKVSDTIPVRTDILARITHPDFHLLNGFETETIGIADVKQFCKILHKKPFKAVAQIGVILGFEHATNEAQNALLKEFEEHADNVIYILGVLDESTLLATIRSRATIHYIGAQVQKKEQKEFLEIAHAYLSPTIDLLDTYAKINNKEWSKQTAEMVLRILYEQLPKNRGAQKKLLRVQKSSEYLRNNVSPKQVLLALFLEFRKKS